jgi:multiple sugar transport system substrate-binding protein
VDKSGDYNFGNNSGDNFGQGTVALYLGWGFMHNLLKTNFPQTEFGSFEIPTPTADVPYAYHRYNGESTFGINKNAPAEQQAVAQDIVRFFLANDALEKEFCLANSVFPAKNSLASDPDILGVSSIAVLASHIDRYIWPGPMPSAVENNMKIALEDIFYNGADIGTALQNAEDTCNQELASGEFVSVEPQYKYAGEAK